MSSATASRASFGAAVRARRRQRGLAPKALAAEAGLHPSYVDPIEHGRLGVQLDTIVALANALGGTAAELVALAERFEADGSGASASDP